MFTCISCKVAFEDAAEQRSHFATDWHRYNMKRRVADLPPLPAASFNQKVLERREQNAVKTDPRSLQCTTCSKSFSTENAYRSHIQSKRHRDREAAQAARNHYPASSVAPINGTGDKEGGEHSLQLSNQQQDKDEEDEGDTDESDEEEDIDERLAASRRRIRPSDCLFCSHRSQSIEEALLHMRRAHTFFIPHPEAVVDLSGLLSYLGEKIVIGNLCLYCPNGGKEFGSVEAARRHMLDKGHCKMPYTTSEDHAEYMDFYGDEAPGEDEWEDIEGETEGDRTSPSQPYVTDGGYSLVLPSGRILGHRALKIYYAQHPRQARPQANISSKVQLIRERLADPSQALVPSKGGHGAYGSGLEVMRARNPGEARWARKQGSSFLEQKKQANFRERIGYVGNNQKHFRDPLLQ